MREKSQRHLRQELPTGNVVHVVAKANGGHNPADARRRRDEVLLSDRRQKAAQRRRLLGGDGRGVLESPQVGDRRQGLKRRGCDEVGRQRTRLLRQRVALARVHPIGEAVAEAERSVHCQRVADKEEAPCLHGHRGAALAAGLGQAAGREVVDHERVLHLRQANVHNQRDGELPRVRHVLAELVGLAVRPNVVRARVCSGVDHPAQPAQVPLLAHELHRRHEEHLVARLDALPHRCLVTVDAVDDGTVDDGDKWGGEQRPEKPRGDIGGDDLSGHSDSLDLSRLRVDTDSTARVVVVVVVVA
eukprot:PhM_4_TR6805/c0_g1_i1/m.59535